MTTVRDIVRSIEEYAPVSLQEKYDNTGLQLGNPDAEVKSVLVCLSVTEDVLAEALRRDCNMILSHHPLLFKGLKCISGRTSCERIVINAIKHDIVLYAAHTNLDFAIDGVSYEMAHQLDLHIDGPFIPTTPGAETGLGIIGNMAEPVPALEFLRMLKTTFSVKSLRYSADTSKIVIRRVALCGGSGSSFINDAIEAGADAYVCGDLKYHDFDSFASQILLADIGHYESEFCSRKILHRIVKTRHPEVTVYMSEADKNPLGVL